MTVVQVIFYIFAVVATASAVSVITARNPVHSVLSLVVTFFAMAAVWMILRAEFLSLILILVYVGAVMTLFLFVVMMLNVTTSRTKEGFVSYLPFAVIVAILFTGLIMFALGPDYIGFDKISPPGAKGENYNNLQTLGRVLYTDYAYAFEVAGVLLISAIIAAIMLTFRGPMQRKTQQVDKQLSVRPEDRVRLLKMPAEKKPPQQDEGE